MIHIIDSGSAPIVTGHMSAPDRPDVVKPSIELWDDIKGQPYTVLITQEQAVQLLTLGMERWLTTRERSEVIEHFIR